jgi:hypothetical protein
MTNAIDLASGQTIEAEAGASCGGAIYDPECVAHQFSSVSFRRFARARASLRV